MPPTQRPDPAPLEVDIRRIVAAGTVLWLVALVVLALLFLDELERHDATWWLWTCACGAGLGLVGLFLVRNRRPGG